MRTMLFGVAYKRPTPNQGFTEKDHMDTVRWVELEQAQSTQARVTGEIL